MRLTLEELELLIVEESKSNFPLFEFSKFGLSAFDMFLKQYMVDFKNLSIFSSKKMCQLMINYKRHSECIESIRSDHIRSFLFEKNLLEKNYFTKEYLVSFAFDFLSEEEFKEWFYLHFCENKKIKENTILVNMKYEEYKDLDFDYGLSLSFSEILKMENNYKVKSMNTTLFHYLLTEWLKENHCDIPTEFRKSTLHHKLFFIEHFSILCNDNILDQLMFMFLKDWYKKIDSTNDVDKMSAIQIISLLDTIKNSEHKRIADSLERSFFSDIFSQKTDEISKIRSEYNLGLILKNESFINTYLKIGVPLSCIRQEIIFYSSEDKKNIFFDVMRVSKNASIEELKVELRSMQIETLSSLFKQISPLVFFRLVKDFKELRAFMSVGGSRLTVESIDLCWTIIAHYIQLCNDNLEIEPEDYDLLLLNYKY